jgi:membrane protein
MAGKTGFFGLVKETATEFGNDKAPRLAAALAYYAIFSLAPLLVITIAVAGFVFGEQAARGELVEQIGGAIGPQGAEMVQTMIANAGREGGGIVASILGLIALLFGASGVFIQLKDAMNTIWSIEPEAGGLKKTIVTRIFSFAMVLTIGFLLLISLVVSALLAAVARFMEDLLPLSPWVWQLVDAAVSIAVITVLFALMFRYLPDRRIPWKNVWAGALFTAVLFVIGKFAIGLYMGQATVGSAFGAAGALAILLVWIYYSGLILLFGAEFTEVYARAREPRPAGAPVRQRHPAAAGGEAPSPAAAASALAAVGGLPRSQSHAAQAPAGKSDRASGGKAGKVVAASAGAAGGLLLGAIAGAVTSAVLLVKGTRRLFRF